MLDFVTCRRVAPERGENRYQSAVFVEYWDCGGVYYLKRSVAFDWDYTARKDRRISGLSVNGSRVLE